MVYKVIIHKENEPEIHVGVCYNKKIIKLKVKEFSNNGQYKVELKKIS